MQETTDDTTTAGDEEPTVDPSTPPPLPPSPAPPFSILPQDATTDDVIQMDDEHVGHLSSFNPAADYTGCQHWTCCICCFCRIVSSPTDACVCTFDPQQSERRRLYPNGLVSVLVAQVVFVLGWIASASVFGDCRLVMADSSVVDPDLWELIMVTTTTTFDARSSEQMNQTNGTIANSISAMEYTGSNRSRTGLGIFFFQGPNGECVYGVEDFPNYQQLASHNNSNITTQDELVQAYVEYLGTDWVLSQAAAAGAVFLAICCTAILLTYSCWSHTKRFRQVWVCLVLLVLCPLQLVVLQALGTSVCQQADCVPGRTFYVAVCAAGCFILSAALICTKSKNYYPGIERFGRPEGEIELETEDKATPSAAGAAARSRQADSVHNSTSNNNDNNGDNHRLDNGCHDLFASTELDGLGDAQEVPISPLLYTSVMQRMVEQQNDEPR